MTNSKYPSGMLQHYMTCCHNVLLYVATCIRKWTYRSSLLGFFEKSMLVFQQWSRPFDMLLISNQAGQEGTGI